MARADQRGELCGAQPIQGPRAAEDALQDRNQRRNVRRFLESRQVVWTDRKNLPARGWCDAQARGGIAVHFEDFDLQHHFAARLFNLAHQFRGQGDVPRRIAERDGMGADIELDVRDAGDLANGAQDFGQLLRRSRSGKLDGPFLHRRILAPLAGVVLGHEKEVGIQWAQECSGLVAQDGDHGCKIHVRHTQTDRARRQIGVERSGQAKLPRDFLIGAARFAVNVETPRPGSRLKTRQARQEWLFLRRLAGGQGGELRQALLRDRVAGV